jgi:hypothetical protein
MISIEENNSHHFVHNMYTFPGNIKNGVNAPNEVLRGDELAKAKAEDRGCLIKLLILVVLLIVGVLWVINFFQEYDRQQVAIEKEKISKRNKKLKNNFHYPIDIVQQINSISSEIRKVKSNFKNVPLNGKSLFVELSLFEYEKLNNNPLSIYNLYCNEDFTDSIVAWDMNELNQVVYLIKDSMPVGKLNSVSPLYPYNPYSSGNPTNIEGFIGVTWALVYSYPDLNLIIKKRWGYEQVGFNVKIKRGEKLPDTYTSRRLDFSELETKLIQNHPSSIKLSAPR